MKLLFDEWGGILLWMVIVAATKITHLGKSKKQTINEIIAEICYSFFGGIVAYLSIRNLKDFQYKWLVITAGAVGGADILRFFTLNVKGILRASGKKIQDKIDKIDPTDTNLP